MIFHSYVSLPEGKHCEYLWFFSNLAWIKGCHPAWSNDKPTLGRQWALRPEHDKFFGRWEDGYGLPLVYHWFTIGFTTWLVSSSGTSLNLRCQVSAAVVLAASFTMQRWQPQGHHEHWKLGAPKAPKASKAPKIWKENQPSCGNGWYPWDLGFFGQERVRSNGQKV